MKFWAKINIVKNRILSN